MEFSRKYYSYSMKNIPLPFKKLYKTILIEKVKLLIKRLRWKAHLYDNSGLNTSNPLNYIFKSRKCSPQHQDKKVKNKFLDQLHKDISSIKKSKNIFIFADKTRKIYETDKNTYNKLLTDSISKTYKKGSIIYTTRSIKKLKLFQITGVSERVDCLAKSNAFVSLKDHKPNFSSNPKCCLKLLFAIFYQNFLFSPNDR